LAFISFVTQNTAKFLKELSSTLLFSFLKPGGNSRKHAHKRGRMNYSRSSLVGTDEGFGTAYNAGFSCGMSIIYKLVVLSITCTFLHGFVYLQVAVAKVFENSG